MVTMMKMKLIEFDHVVGNAAMMSLVRRFMKLGTHDWVS